jgi:transposase
MLSQMQIGKNALFEPIFYCQNCNIVLDRDVNASTNIGNVAKYQIQNNGKSPKLLPKAK